MAGPSPCFPRSGITLTFLDPGLRERIRLDSVTCVLDADQVFAHPDYPALMELKLLQIGFADMLIINKVDLAGPAQLKKVREWLDNSFNRLRIVETSRCEIPLEILLSVGRFDPARSGLDRQALEHAGCADANCRDERHGHDHTMTFSTWSYETDRPLSLEELREVAHKLPGNIYRAKGVIHTSDTPEQPAVLQVVGRRVDISMQEEWGKRAPRTRIVAIGAPGTLDGASLREKFDACIVNKANETRQPLRS